MADRLPFQVVWHEDGSAILLGRVVGDTASGTATGKPGEGYFLLQAALSAIAYSVYDITGAAQVIASTALTISTVILDTPVTTSILWTVDSYGYNFKATMPVTAFPTGGSEYKIEVKFTTTGSFIGWGEWQGIARPKYVS